MTTATFIPNSNQAFVNWSDPARWSTGVVPNDPAVDVIIPTTTVVATGQPYVSFITETGTYAVGSLAISNNYLLLNGKLNVTHDVNLFAGGEIDMRAGSSLSAVSIDNNGIDIQGSGSINVSGAFLNETLVVGSGLSLTAASLNNTGALFATSGNLNVTVNPGGFTNLSGSTLTGGSYQAGYGNQVANSSGLYLNVGGVIATDAASISLNGGGAIYSFDDVSHSYVSITSSLHSIAHAGQLSLAKQIYNWGNLTVDGVVTLSENATLNSTLLTVDAGGVVGGTGTLGGSVRDDGMIVAGSSSTPVNVPNSLVITGPVPGSGTFEIAPAIVHFGIQQTFFTPVTLELGAATSVNVRFQDSHGILILDDPTSYSGAITPTGFGDQVILHGISLSSVTSYDYSGDSSGGTLAIHTASNEIDLHFSGAFVTASFALTAGPQTLSSDPPSLRITRVDVPPAIGLPGSISINDATILEGNSGTKVMTFTVTRTGGTAAFSVNYATANDTALSGSDYLAVAGTLNFASGANTQTISVTISGDTTVETDETFFVNLFGATNGASISDGLGIGTITNDDHSLLPVPPDAAPADFNSDAKSDILWRNDNGAVALWTMNGAQKAADQVVSNIGNDWHLDATADFNADGMADILWRHDSGTVALWTMNGAQKLADQIVSGMGNDWTIADTADFNGDGKTDILWRHDSGAVALWTMNGAQKAGDQVVSPIANDWKIADTADFNGDGKTDILLRHDSGAVAIWTMNGAQKVADQIVSTIANDWHFVKTADFNGDGKADILLRHDSGAVAIWTMNGAQKLADQIVSNIANDWHFVDTADFNGDGKADILLRHDSGAVAIWTMNGGQKAADQVVSNLGNDWQFLGVGDFNADHKADILWRHDTGAVALWTMNGAQKLADQVVSQMGHDWMLA